MLSPQAPLPPAQLALHLPLGAVNPFGPGPHLCPPMSLRLGGCPTARRLACRARRHGMPIAWPAAASPISILSRREPSAF